MVCLHIVKKLDTYFHSAIKNIHHVDVCARENKERIYTYINNHPWIQLE